MYQLQTSVGETLPVSLVLLTDGQRGWVVFIKTRQFTTIIDMAENPEDGKYSGISAVFDMDGFSIAGEEYRYNTPIAYIEIPEMLQWLKAQNMVMPEIVF
jgi:hypothetical protein